MAVFLHFDETDTLVSVIENSSGPFGSVDPLDVFLPKHSDERRLTHSAVEVFPEILLETRPKVFHLILGHAKLTSDGIQIAELEEIQERRDRDKIRDLEDNQVSAASSMALLMGAAGVLRGGLPPSHRDDIETLEADVIGYDLELEAIRAGEVRAPIPGELVELAGTKIRI